MTEQEIAQLQETVATLQAEKVTLQDQVTVLTQQKTLLEAEAETQGARLTAALDDLTAMTANRDLYKNANAALQRAIHEATASVPQMGELTVQALTQIQNNLVQVVQNMVGAMINEVRGQ